MKKEDGGYYAVKGFVYQFDYTILEIFNQLDNNTIVKIEQEQDLSYENYIVQVKYYETKYNTSQQKQKVKDATIKLLIDFRANQNNEYCLYIHLNGKNREVKKYSTIADFDKFLGKNANMYADILKEKFIEKYTIVYASNFKEQFFNIIKKIQQEFKCKEEAYIYHALIRNHLLNILTNNTTADSGNRGCCKQDILNLIGELKSRIVYSAYKEVLGELRYLKFIKSQFPKVDFTYYNYLFIGDNIKETSSHTISHLIKQIVDKYFLPKNGKAKPFNVIIAKKDDELLRIKRELIKLNVKFNDGYESYNEFTETNYNEAPFVETKTSRREKRCSFSVRLISYNTFCKMENPILADRIYSFGNCFTLDNLFDRKVPYFAIDKISINQMLELFK
ncbi:MAG: hypothetical protein IMY72_02010 [Bacteroidetes bacterium]|nr:hypothetical protein [Bacteroidota bacterium]